MSGKEGILKYGRAEQLRAEIARRRTELELLEKRLQQMEAEGR